MNILCYLATRTKKVKNSISSEVKIKDFANIIHEVLVSLKCVKDINEDMFFVL